MVKSKVLLIHQDRRFRNEVAICLSEAGYQVSQAADGRDGFRLLYDVHPDLVLIELSRCPGNSTSGEDGWETLARLRLFTDIPALVVDKQLSLLELRRIQEIHFTEFVEGPISPADIVAKVKGLLEGAADPEPHAEPDGK